MLLKYRKIMVSLKTHTTYLYLIIKGYRNKLIPPPHINIKCSDGGTMMDQRVFGILEFQVIIVHGRSSGYNKELFLGRHFLLHLFLTF